MNCQKKLILFIGILMLLYPCGLVYATKFAEVSALDQEFLMVHFLDGEVTFRDNGKGAKAFESFAHETGMDTVKRYGTALNTSNAIAVSNWILKSTQDANYGADGKSPLKCYRKSKLNGMSEQEWQSSDYKYEYTLEHFIFLRLPSSLVQGNSYTLSINSSTNTDSTSVPFTFDIYTNRSEAIHVNLVGYIPVAPTKAVDLYYWMGDSSRDYKAFEGKDVYIYNTTSKEKTKAGSVAFWKSTGEEAGWYDMTRSPVWNADFPGFSQPGTFRIVIDGVGCSPDFVLADDVYYDPFKVSVQGFFYMRIGQDSLGGGRPVPRRPLWLPGKDPAKTKVYITTMQPYHSEWESFSGGDKWDNPEAWASYRKSGNPVNEQAWGGHSDALDWDRHLGHIPIIYDMLLPYILTKGAISDDNLGIAESKNGIPDIIDEARYEVDYWLRLRDGKGYSHGLTNPDDNNVFYQAGTTAISAWANGLNCAMIADCFRIAGKAELMNAYRDSAIIAFEYAGQQADQMPDATFPVGDQTITGNDLKMSAAAYLYNVTGETKYEDIVKSTSAAKTATSELSIMDKTNQLWGTAAYVTTPQPVHYPELLANMKASIIKEAKDKEAGRSAQRPTRRGTDQETGYFQTEQNMHRTMIAHMVSENQAEKEQFYKALVLEADWSLGRNPLNIIQMTTASTSLQSKRSVQSIYTSGCNDGVLGQHPGHTPYLNVDDWDAGMVMGKPSWMTGKGYPAFSKWPMAEAYFPTRYVWAHSEFTPQQTMRGKTALYGYLYGIGGHRNPVRRSDKWDLGSPQEMVQLTIGKMRVAVPAGENCTIRLFDLSGKLLWESAFFSARSLTMHTMLPALVMRTNRVAVLEIGSKGKRVFRSRVLTLR
jgi:endoglucanase